MKTLSLSLVLIIWFILTVILCFSVIGLLVLLDDESYWQKIPKQIFEILKKP